jgi:hypothetical protein
MFTTPSKRDDFMHRYIEDEGLSEEETNEKANSNQKLTISSNFIEREDDYYKEAMITKSYPVARNRYT